MATSGTKKGGKKTGGRKKGALNKSTLDIRGLARSAGPEALQTLIDIMKNGTTDKARISAANAILDRAYGKAPQPMEHSGEVIYSVEIVEYKPDPNVSFSNPEINNSDLSRN